MGFPPKHISKLCHASCVAALFLLVACSGEDKTERKKVAQVYDSVLYEDELVKMIPEGLTAEEESKIREELIENWITQNIVLERVQQELPDAETMLRPLMERYKTSLLMYEYEKQLVSKRLDTTVSADEVNAYYTENIKDFELDDYLVQAIFIKAHKDLPGLGEVNSWFRSTDSVDLASMKEWATEQADNFYYDEESWLYYEDIQKMLPEEMVYNKRYFIVNKLARKYEDEDYVYLFRVLDFRTGISPLEFERNNIKSRIVQMRMAELRENLRNDIINEAYSADKVVRY